MSNEDRVRAWLEQAGCRDIRLGASDNLVSTCPFHEVKDGTQFSININSGAYCCFSGKCGVGGNIITFLVRALDWSWQKAIWAAEQFRFVTEFKNEELIPFEERNRHGRPAREKIVDEALLGLYEFCPKYMLRRGFTKDTLRKWEIGYDVGIERVTIPVRNEFGQLVGFSKRGIFDFQKPKYLHLDFPKGEYLYGLCFHGKGYRKRPVWVTEGQLDTIALDQLGRVSVSTMGTRISKTQVQLMAKFGTVILALDNPEVDEDGRKTILRVGDDLLALKAPGSIFVPEYPKGCKDAADVLQKATKAETKEFVTNLYPYEDWRLTA